MVSQGSVNDCGAFTFRAYDDRFRVACGRYGPDSLQAYQDFGPGAPRGGLFFVAKTNGFQNDQFAKEMTRIDPSHMKIWQDARVLSGNFRAGKVFSGTIPQQGTTFGNSTMVKNPEYNFTGQIRTIGTSQYILMHVDSGFGSNSSIHREIVRENFEKFTASIKPKK